MAHAYVRLSQPVTSHWSASLQLRDRNDLDTRTHTSQGSLHCNAPRHSLKGGNKLGGAGGAEEIDNAYKDGSTEVRFTRDSQRISTVTGLKRSPTEPFQGPVQSEITEERNEGDEKGGGRDWTLDHQYQNLDHTSAAKRSLLWKKAPYGGGNGVSLRFRSSPKVFVRIRPWKSPPVSLLRFQNQHHRCHSILPTERALSRDPGSRTTA